MKRRLIGVVIAVLVLVVLAACVGSVTGLPTPVATLIVFAAFGVVAVPLSRGSG